MPRRILTSILLILVLFSLGSATIEDDPERQRAFALFNDWKLAEALPLFEKLAERYPNDPQVFETYGLITIWHAPRLENAAARKEARKRGRELLVKAEKLGSNSALIHTLLDSISPDGGRDEKYSAKKEVDEMMRAGEAAFTRNDMPKAIEMYQRALALDPNMYEAALWTGDVYYKTADQRQAGEWFARAIAINPDRETAYRYWGDSLMKQGKVTEAGDKFIEAYIAEPYSRLARVGIIRWGEKVHINLGHPEIAIPTSVTAKSEKEMTINLDPNSFKKDKNDPSGAAWVTYGLARATWPGGEFAKNYPEEKKYRHSLKEEAAAMRAAISVVEEKKLKDSTKIDQSLQLLIKLDKEGLLESFILLALPDEGIVQDYVAYRRTNIEKLRRYVKDYVLTGGAGPKQ
jgi:tetratricopeptide (TPR) repeat protein